MTPSHSDEFLRLVRRHVEPVLLGAGFVLNEVVVGPGPVTAPLMGYVGRACNLAKDAVGWRSRPTVGGTVATVTPTGHRYLSRVPPSPAARGPSGPSRLEVHFRDVLLSA